MIANPFLDDPTQWASFAKYDDVWQKVAEEQAKDPPPPSTLDDVPAKRLGWEARCRKDADNILAATDGAVTETEIFIPVRDGHKVRALLYQPASTSSCSEGRPLVVLLHGGGFCFGTAEMESPLCIRSVQSYGCVALSLEYRLAPEHKFPVPWEDVWDALQWITKNATTHLSADLSLGFVLGGCSAGGHLTIPLTHRARDESLSPPITGTFLSVTPSLAWQRLDITSPAYAPEAERHRSLYQSRTQLADGIMLKQSSILLYDAAVEPDMFSPYWSPLLWPAGHANLPPTYLQVCGADMLRDDALIYERELRLGNGLKTKVDVYVGMPHVFWFAKPEHPQAKKFHEDATKGVGWLLRRGMD